VLDVAFDRGIADGRSMTEDEAVDNALQEDG